MASDAFWKCCNCGRAIGNDEWTSRGRTDNDHICEDCFWKLMGGPTDIPEGVN